MTKTHSFTKKSNRSVIIGIPIVAVILTLLFWFVYQSTPMNEVVVNFFKSLIITGLIWTGCMVIVRYLWKRFPWQRRPREHLGLLIILIPSWALIVMIGLERLLMALFGIEYPNHDIGMISMIMGLFFTLLITSIYEAAYFYRQWKYNFNISVRLEKDSLEAKYETLKTQINPHFLFNSLNTLMNYLENNTKALEYVDNLSDFMRYVLKIRDKEVVMLREEIKMIEKYCYIQKSRFGEKLDIQIDVPERYYHYSLPPLVLQMLLENAIKHNVISRDKPLWIKVFVVKEYIYVENKLQEKFEVPSTQIGLKNIIERYKFLTHKKVDIKETSNIFKVGLPLVTTEL